MSPPAPNRQTRGAQSVLSHRPFGGPLVEWCGIRRDGKPPLAGDGVELLVVSEALVQDAVAILGTEVPPGPCEDLQQLPDRHRRRRTGENQRGGLRVAQTFD